MKTTKILIIDDMANFRRLARALIEPELSTAIIDEMAGANEQTDIQKIIQSNYDLILLDYQLEGHDGLSVQRDLREAGCTAPIILLTAHGNERLAVQAIKEGAYDYLPKTQLNQSSLVNAIKGALQSTQNSSDSHALFGDNIQVKGYKPIKLLGRGTYSMVYLAESEKDHQQVVLKILIVSNVNSKDIERFMREYEIMTTLTHENIGIIYNQEFTEDIVFMLMEHLEYGTLKERIALQGKLPPNEAILIIIQLCKALSYIHKNGVLHRDIKPANILFRDQKTPVIVDFGIASKTEQDETLTEKGSVVGTPAYMSPEQAIGEEASPQSDLYSIGVVFYQMLTGKKPFVGDTSHITMYRLVHDRPPRLPDEYIYLQEIMDKMLEKKAQDRYQTGDEIADTLYRVQ